MATVTESLMPKCGLGAIGYLGIDLVKRSAKRRFIGTIQRFELTGIIQMREYFFFHTRTASEQVE
jgi:hypothetical protein